MPRKRNGNGVTFEQFEASVSAALGAATKAPIKWHRWYLRRLDMPEKRAKKTHSSKNDREWIQEQAMEAGMLHGIDAYNEMMELVERYSPERHDDGESEESDNDAG